MSARRLLGAHLPAASPERRETVAGECLGCMTQFAVDVRLPLPAGCDLEQALARTSRGRARRPVEPHEDRPPRVMIAIHVDPEVRDQLRAIAYEQKIPLRGLVCAGLNAVFAQHHKPEIAR